MSSNRLIQDWFENNVDFRHRVVYLRGSRDEDNEVDATMAELAIKGLMALDLAKDEDIKLIINTPGGLVEEGMAIYDCIRSCRSFVRGIVLGHAHSMGAVILQACDLRIMAPHATLLIHQGSLELINNFKEVMAQAEFEKRYAEMVNAILLKRIREKHPRFPKARFNQIINTDSFFTAEEAVRIGLADEVM